MTVAVENIHPAADPGEVVDALIARRKELGLRQADVAQRMHVAQGTVCQFERLRSPRMYTVLRYAEAVGASLSFTLEPLPDEEAET